MTVDRETAAGRTKTVPHTRGWRRILSSLFGGQPVHETVSTQMHFEISTETAWSLIRFYEEVPGVPPLLLRTFMPYPVRTDGSKSGVGATVRCIYKGGDLVKRITVIEPPIFIGFEVTEQCLGIEGCAVAQGGSYAIHPRGNGADIELTTKYLAYLYPRLLWRPLEKLVTGQLHRHVLRGMRSLLPKVPVERRVPVQGFAPPSESEPLESEREAVCATSPSSFPR